MPSLQRMTLDQFEEVFPDEQACIAFLIARRWPEGIRCPRCASDNVRPELAMALKWKCVACRKEGEYRFSHLAGTFFENTKAPLRVWFRVLHAIIRLQQTRATGHQVTALEVHRFIKTLPYRTVWNLCRRLCAGLESDEFCELMGISRQLFAIRAPHCRSASNEYGSDAMPSRGRPRSVFFHRSRERNAVAGARTQPKWVRQT